ncbi:diuretic hormone receptor-like isoform X2 [Antedon mediterranea]|uniref:diuretic hormone receptor-like isoform X2 n=1 Tax=Antedon mediterranea TaxID=105859 RepID=UPI003AF732E8
MAADYADTVPSDYSSDYSSYHKLEVGCNERYEYEEMRLRNSGKSFCPATLQCYICWPPTIAGQTATASCPVELDIAYGLNGGNADNDCNSDGNWTALSNVQCEHILLSGDVCRCHHCDALNYISMVGYPVSLIALVVAFFMIVGIRALRVKRNKIHANLLASFICLYTLSLFSVILYFYVDPAPPLCQIITMSLSYFTLCNFVWMSVEGFYLYALVVLAFRLEPDKIRMWKYCLLGWGPPAILILCQTMAYVFQENKESTSQEPTEYQDYTQPINATDQHEMSPSYSYSYYSNYSQHGAYDTDSSNCWWTEHILWQQYAFIITPILLLLAMNVFFLAMILKVLLPKIKATGQNNIRNHLKMLKSAIVLVVLLGTVYIVFLIEPQIKNVTPLAKYVMSVINTTLQCTQGLAVAILYVFMNSEVQTKVKSKLNRRLERLRLGKEARKRSSYLSDKTQTFSVSDSQSSIDKQSNGRTTNGRTDHDSNGNAPSDLINDNEHNSGDDDVFQETTLIQIEEKTNDTSNGYVKLKDMDEIDDNDKSLEETELSKALLVDVHL